MPVQTEIAFPLGGLTGVGPCSPCNTFCVRQVCVVSIFYSMLNSLKLGYFYTDAKYTFILTCDVSYL